jgi:peroxiredoxin
VTSQSPAEGSTPTKNYLDAWASMRLMVIEKGFSWSGREKDHLFLNVGDGTFAELSSLSRADAVGDGRALCVVDWDDDGRLDLFLKSRTAPRVAFFRNQMRTDGHFVAVDLVGTTCNRDAIGARVEVTAGGRVLRKTLHAGEGYLAQSSKRLHFGLGPAERIERIAVRWPDGNTSTFGDLAVDERYRIVQGDDAPQRVPARPAPGLASAPSSTPSLASKVPVRAPLIEKLPLAAFPAPGFEAPERRVSDLAGGPVLLNLWGTTCKPCLEEFSTWKERRADIDKAGLRLVTLCVDAIDDRTAALEILNRFGLAKDAGFADEAFLEVLEPVMHEILDTSGTLLLPTSFLLDARGQIVCLYQGKVDVDVLLRDTRRLSAMDPENLSSTALIEGRRLFVRGRDFAKLASRYNDLGRPELSSFYKALAH